MKSFNQYRPDPVARALPQRKPGAVAAAKKQDALMMLVKEDLLMPGFNGRALKYVGPLAPISVDRLPSQFIKGREVIANVSTGQTVPAEVIEQASQSYADSGVWYGPQNLKVIASVDYSPFGPLLHLSVSYPNRDPSWNEIKSIRTLFFPEWMNVSMRLPAQDIYINVHQFCYQMHQDPDLLRFAAQAKAGEA